MREVNRRMLGVSAKDIEGAVEIAAQDDLAGPTGRVDPYEFTAIS
jgi:hypothetical protein